MLADLSYYTLLQADRMEPASIFGLNLSSDSVCDAVLRLDVLKYKL